jgi:hypothetical protein
MAFLPVPDEHDQELMSQVRMACEGCGTKLHCDIYSSRQHRVVVGENIKEPVRKCST